MIPTLMNQGLLAIAFFEAAAIFILLVLYLLLYRSLPERFFRFWVAGWVLYAGYGLSRLLYRWDGSTFERVLMFELLLAGSVFFLAAVMEYTGRGQDLRWLVPVAVLGGLLLALRGLQAEQGEGGLAGWAGAGLQSMLFLVSGWLLWRYSRGQRGLGPMLLAGALLLRGLHWLDHADWPHQVTHMMRLSFDGLLEVAIGVGMVVLVLEDARARAEDLNTKLRQLTLITAATTQTLKVDEVLREVLQHLIHSLNASHGLVRLLDEQSGQPELVLRAKVGFSERMAQQRARVRASEPWARQVLEQELPFVVYNDASDPALRGWMAEEKLCVLVLVRLPGKDATLGVLGIGCHKPRTFRDDELNFLVNVANLLGLTVQNVWLFERVSEAQRQWMYTFDSIADPILVHDTEHRLLRVNRTVAERLKTEPVALIGRPLQELLCRGEQPWTHCPYCEGAAGRGDSPDPSFGGYLLVSTSDFHDASGKRLGTIHVLKDITDRNRAEQMYRNLFQNVREGVFVSTPEGHFVDFNDAFMHMLGHENRKDLMGADIAPTFYVDPADRERLQRLLTEHGAVNNYEYRLRRQDGEIIEVSESSFVTRDAGGDIVAYQGFVLDISERKRAEAELRRRNRELMVLNSIAQTLSHSLPLGELLQRALAQLVELFGADMGAIYLLDEKTVTLHRQGAVGFRSEYARQFPPTGISPELVEHIRRVGATVLNAQGLALPPIFQDLQKKEGVAVSHVVVLWSKDRVLGGLVVASRTMREFSAAELNLLTAAGNQIAATIEKTSLYEETRRAYDHLRRTQEQLLQSEKMSAVGQLISGVAHELNNPLTAILGYSQLLAGSEEVTARGREYVEKLQRQAQRTHRVVQNLLSFARQHKPERSPVRLNQVLEDTLMLREYDLKVNNIFVHRDFDPHLPLTSCDPHQLQQVFLNILNNAVDAVIEHGGRGEIWISSRHGDGQLIVEFTDSGPGVKDPTRVFDPFYTTKAVGKGTGLGLSICYGIVKEHNGEIQARNAPPRGACFRITLPVLPVSDLPEALPEPPAEALAWGHVLVVDDEEAVLDLERELLQHYCEKVHTARSGREAVELLSRQSVDVVVSDLKMPGEITGWELFQWIQQHRPDLVSRLVFTVSDAGTAEVRRFLGQTHCPIVQKPFQVEDFLRVLRQVLEQARATLTR